MTTLPIRVAVLSDLHVGRGARARDLSPVPTTSQFEDGYRAGFIAFLKKAKVTADYIVCPGDASDMAQPAEFLLASEFVLEVAYQLGVGEEQILFVPGNHDVNWASFSLYPDDKTGLGRELRYSPLLNTNQIFSRCLKRSSSDILTDPYFTTWEDSNIVAVAHNSSWHDDPAESLHHGSISGASLTDLEALLKSIDLRSTRLRLFLVHHHPLAYGEPPGTPADLSIMSNAQDLLNMLWRYNFDLLIHGHKHHPHFGSYSKDSYSPIAILGAGSISAILSTRWTGAVANQFHRITIEGRHKDTSHLYGYVENWAYLYASGWQKSRPYHGMEHKSSFGVYAGRSELARKLGAIIPSIRGAKSYLEWNDLVSAEPDLKYVSATTILEVLDGISGSLAFRRHGDSLEDIVLLF